MVGRKPLAPREGWLTGAAWTVVITLVTVAISTVVASAIMISVYGSIETAGLLTAILMPLVLTPPIVVVLSMRHLHLERVNAELQKLAYRDSLLDCMNRRGFTASLEIALQYASPHRPCALLIVDADNFKQVNDRFGHDQGDIALEIILNALKSATRSADLLGRLGGEEFGVFLPGTDEEQARVIAKRICTAVASARFAPDDTVHRLSVSIGGAIAADPTSFERIFRVADQRLYAAKQSGRNRSEFAYNTFRDKGYVA